MFIRKDNTLKWNWIAVAGLITLVLVIAGIFGLDKIVYSWIRNPNCAQWSFGGGFFCSTAFVLGKVFSTKVWLALTSLAVLSFFVYKAVTNENDFRFAFVKIKNSYAFYVFCSVWLAFLTTGVLKFLIGRSRPIIYEALDMVLFVPGTFETIFNSMPSGHSAVSFAGLVMIGLLMPRFKWLTWSLAIIVAVSRIYIGAHWPSDIVFGAVVGMVCADVVKVVLKRINSK